MSEGTVQQIRVWNTRSTHYSLEEYIDILIRSEYRIIAMVATHYEVDDIRRVLFIVE